MTDAERQRLIEGLCEGRFDLREQLNVVALIPPTKRDMFDTRLRVLAAYEATPPHSMEKTAAAAAELSMSPRNVSHLLTKMRKLGPAIGLAPNHRVKQRSSARTGLHPDVDQALIDHLKVDPEAKLAVVYRSLISEFGKTLVPSEPTVRTRISELRTSPLIEFAASRISVGQDLVIDQCGLDVAASGFYAVATFLIDKQSRTILGLELSGDEGVGAGLGHLIASVIRSHVSWLPANLRIAPSIRAIEWVVPPGLEQRVSDFEEVTARLGIEGRCVIGGRRHGSVLRRLIGNRLGPFIFRENTSGAAERAGEDIQQRPEISIMEAFHEQVTIHNEKIRDAFGVGAAPQDEDEREANISAIGTALSDVFASVLPAPLAAEVVDAVGYLPALKQSQL
ncbi:hypothetical protein M2333_003108 [Sphingobium sp. B11D3B]|uniref:hypothetical protein n=1 Tax=Sphingobium sp. B11D3B TaxID=2940575 RepID=UPI0022266B7F|nr:hypothetical protein [Sphingobium sp. B11D3B]MCW2390062.1 hypothetical protein [Sphingobium sp. B11D3B]